MTMCTICFDDTVKIVWGCPNKACDYAMCRECLTEAFDDASGANVRDCPACKTPTAAHMVETLVGKNVVRHVEQLVRPKVKFEVKREYERDAASRVVASEYKDRAKQLFVTLAEKLNMCCPRCDMVFNDYDGCNALTCGNPACKAAFCAVCLADCGSDAHAHLRSAHGGYFGKEQSVRAKEEREKAIVDKFILSIASEPSEVREMVRMLAEKVVNMPSEDTYASEAKGRNFVQQCQEMLKQSICLERLTLLSESDEYNANQPITINSVSPRNCVPPEFTLCLCLLNYSTSYSITLDRNGESIKLITSDDKTSKLVLEESIGADMLIDLHLSLQCCVVAFEGCRRLYQTRRPTDTKKTSTRDKETVDLWFYPLKANGDIDDQPQTLSQIGLGAENVRIVGFLPNFRQMQLHRHITSLESVESIAVTDWIGGGSPRRIIELDDIDIMPQDTLNDLNEQQKKVANPLNLMSAKEVAGPPGTGKTKTIIETIRSVLRCTPFSIVILSERNGAIDAIAQKFESECMRKTSRDRYEITDYTLWNEVLCFGSEGMGRSSKLFRFDDKMKSHPEVNEAKSILERCKAELDTRGKEMRKLLGDTLYETMEYLVLDRDLRKQCSSISSTRDNPAMMYSTLQRTYAAVKSVVEGGKLTYEEITKLVKEHPEYIEHLFTETLRVDSNNDDLARQMKRLNLSDKIPKKSCSMIKQLYRELHKLLSQTLFSEDEVRSIVEKQRKAETNLNATRSRVDTELMQSARVQMSTIGSSHKLMSAEFFAEKKIEMPNNRTFVIFDEAGCIPCYELLGLTRLGVEIVGLLCVGDKHQLPPYNPGSDNQSRNRNGNFRNGRNRNARDQPKLELSSILDASKLSGDNKVTLVWQYRVPQDIADLLGIYVYNGQYKTAPLGNVTFRGFNLVNVPWREDREKYVNYGEVRQCITILRECQGQHYEGIIVLTPYKKQQKRLQREITKCVFDDIDVAVLTIDQCQGQEADVVIMSLVQRPTSFLNLNRLNVALSRVRKKLYMVTDRNDFANASRNTNWPCHLLAKNLLELSNNRGYYDEDDY